VSAWRDQNAKDVTSLQVLAIATAVGRDITSAFAAASCAWAFACLRVATIATTQTYIMISFLF